MTVISDPPFASDIQHPPVAIILVNWNNWQDTLECLNSLLGLDYPAFHIFVVDNDSQDDSVSQISKWCAQPSEAVSVPDSGVRRWTDANLEQSVTHQVLHKDSLPMPASTPDCQLTIIHSGSNLGFAGGCNLGIRCASHESFSFFWFINTDTVVDRTALDALVARATRDDQPGMVGSTVLYYDRPDTVQALAGAVFTPAIGKSTHLGEGTARNSIPKDPAQIEQQLSYIFGASLLVSNTLIRDIGVMQEDYFLYYEEIDWAMRSRDKYVLGFANNSLVFHKSGASVKKISLKSANYYYRNRLRFMKRFFPEYLMATRKQMTSEGLMLALQGHPRHALLMIKTALLAELV